MPLENYYVLHAKALNRQLPSNDRNHYQVHLDDGKQQHRAAINVRSQESPERLLFRIDGDWQHPLSERLLALPPGLHSVHHAAELRIDYIRNMSLDRHSMSTAVETNLPGQLDSRIQKAIGQQCNIFVFGERWLAEDTKDGIFGFSPSSGIHNIHMNQGNSDRFEADNGVYQDGALFIFFPTESRWTAIFLAFQTQSWGIARENSTISE